MVIRHIGVGSLARILAALYALWGFIFGVIVALVALAGAGMASTTAGSESPIPSWLGGLFGVGAIIFLPICYGVFGAIGGALTAVMYNVVAGMVGGLSVETE
jgi:hypothetical protein